MDSILEALVDGKWYKFVTRTEPGYDTVPTDKLVIEEIFVSNVYAVCDHDMSDTGIVVDIGGNVGTFSIFCASLGAKAVCTFEPESLNWERLLANIENNDLGDIIHPINLGVSDVAGERDLIKNQAGSFIEEVRAPTAPLGVSRYPESEKEKVKVISLASVFADNGIPSCDVLKLDCEGSEYDIVEGAPSNVLAKARYITMEFHDTDAITFGKMIAKLTLTHNLHIIGKYDRGGMVYGRRY